MNLGKFMRGAGIRKLVLTKPFVIDVEGEKLYISEIELEPGVVAEEQKKEPEGAK